MRLASLLTLASLTLFAFQLAAGQSVLTQIEQRLQGASSAPAGAASAPGGTAAAASGYLGAELDDENEQGKGIRVTRVRPDGPAASGGLKADDLITAINGKAIKSVDDYDNAKGPPGTRLQMTVERADGRHPITVTLGNRPAPAADQPGGTAPSLGPPTTSPAPPGPAGISASPSASVPSLLPPTGGAATPPETGAADSGTRGPTGRSAPIDLPPPPAADSAGSGIALPAGGGNASLGITVESFNQQARGSSTAPVTRGAIIMAVKPGSPAEAAGLPLGAVIVRIDGRQVDSSDDLIAAIRAARPGQQVELSYYEGKDFERKSVRLGAASGAAATIPGAYGSLPPSSTAPGIRGGSLAIPPAPSYRSPPSPVEVPSRPALGGVGAVSDGVNRPLLEKIERMSENMVKPTGTTTVYDPLVMAALQTRVVQMGDQLKALEDRLKAIESKLGTGGAGATTPSGTSPTPSFGAPPSPGGFGTAPSGTGTNP